MSDILDDSDFENSEITREQYDQDLAELNGFAQRIEHITNNDDLSDSERAAQLVKTLYQIHLALEEIKERYTEADAEALLQTLREETALDNDTINSASESYLEISEQLKTYNPQFYDDIEIIRDLYNFAYEIDENLPNEEKLSIYQDFFDAYETTVLPLLGKDNSNSLIDYIDRAAGINIEALLPGYISCKAEEFRNAIDEARRFQEENEDLPMTDEQRQEYLEELRQKYEQAAQIHKSFGESIFIEPSDVPYFERQATYGLSFIEDQIELIESEQQIRGYDAEPEENVMGDTESLKNDGNPVYNAPSGTQMGMNNGM